MCDIITTRNLNVRKWVFHIGNGNQEKNEDIQSGYHQIYCHADDAVESHRHNFYGTRQFFRNSFDRYRIFYCDCYVLFSCGRVSIYPFKEKICVSIGNLCPHFWNSVLSCFYKKWNIRIFGPQYDLYLTHMFFHFTFHGNNIQSFSESPCCHRVTLLSIFSDWPLFGPIFVLLFVWGNGSSNKMKLAFLISMFLFGFYNFVNGLSRLPMSANILYSLGSMVGLALGGMVILCFYNGKQMEKGKQFSKWFFYLFYPLHLLILGIIRIYSWKL